MKTVIETTNQSPSTSRQRVIAQSISIEGFRPKRVKDDVAEQLVRNGSHVYCPKSLLKSVNGTHHYINSQMSGSQLERI